MALSDPQTVTINSIANTLYRTSTGTNSSIYTANDGLIKETWSHQYGREGRHLARLDHSKIAANPFDSSLNAKYSMSTYLVVAAPFVGYTVAEQKLVVDGFLAQLNASSGALITKLLGGEN